VAVTKMPRPGTSSTTERGRSSATPAGMTMRPGLEGRAGCWPRLCRELATIGTAALTSSPPLVTGSTLFWLIGPEGRLAGRPRRREEGP
jgi:hypothetical protein